MSNSEEEKKRKKKERIQKENINKPPADFKPVHRVLLVFLDATGGVGLVFAFLPSYVFERMGTNSGLHIHSFLASGPGPL